MVFDMMRKLWARLTGGRPMMRAGLAFRDTVTGDYVYFWNDTLGRRWLALHPWSFFRVRIGQPPQPGGTP